MWIQILWVTFITLTMIIVIGSMYYFTRQPIHCGKFKCGTEVVIKSLGGGSSIGRGNIISYKSKYCKNN